MHEQHYCMALPRCNTCSWQVKSTWKRPVDSHMENTAAFHYSFDVCMCRISHRHEENTHSRWGALSFPASLCLSLSQSPPLAFSGVKENHVIIFTDNYQSQTPCKQTGQQRSRHAAYAHPVCPGLLHLDCLPPVQLSKFPHSWLLMDTILYFLHLGLGLGLNCRSQCPIVCITLKFRLFSSWTASVSLACQSCLSVISCLTQPFFKLILSVCSASSDQPSQCVC